MRRCGRRSLAAPSLGCGRVHGFGGHTANRLTGKHIFDHDGARGDDDIACDADARNKYGARSNKSACTNSHATAQDSTRRDVHTVAELAIMVNACSRVDDASLAKDGIRTHACVRQNLRTLADLRRCGDKRRRVNKRRRGEAGTLEHPHELETISIARAADRDYEIRRALGTCTPALETRPAVV